MDAGSGEQANEGARDAVVGLAYATPEVAAIRGLRWLPLLNWLSAGFAALYAAVGGAFTVIATRFGGDHTAGVPLIAVGLVAFTVAASCAVLLRRRRHLRWVKWLSLVHALWFPAGTIAGLATFDVLRKLTQLPEDPTPHDAK